MTNASRVTAYKHNSQTVKISRTSNRSVISKSHKIKRGNLVLSKQMVLIFSIYFVFSLRGEKRGEKTQIHTKRFHSKVKVPLTCIKPHNTNRVSTQIIPNSSTSSLALSPHRPLGGQNHFHCLRSPPVPSLMDATPCQPCPTVWSKLDSLCYPAPATAAPPSSFPWAFNTPQVLEEPWKTGMVPSGGTRC